MRNIFRNRLGHQSRRPVSLRATMPESLETRILLTGSDSGETLTARITIADQQARKAFEFDSQFQSSESARLDLTPRGIATTDDGTLSWTVHRDGRVSVYDADNKPVGTWQATGMVAAEGIATDGTSLWVLDSGVGGVNKVFFYANAVQQRSGELSPDAEFELAAANDEGWGLTTNGQHVWVLNSNVTDEVFKYAPDGTLVGSWLLDSGNALPRGLDIDPANPDDIWTVDRQYRRVFRYEDVVSLNSGAVSATEIFRLPASLKTPQGLAAFATESSAPGDPDDPDEPGDPVDPPAPAEPSAIAVVDDRTNDILEYDAAGDQVGTRDLTRQNGAPRGAAAVENTTWVIDRKRSVHVYENGVETGAWSANGLRKPEGLATDGEQVWIVDRTLDEVLVFANGAALRTGEHDSSAVFPLHEDNGNARGITTDGTHLWVVNGGRVAEVFKYELNGTFVGRWAVDGRVSPRGIAVNSTGDIWLVDKRGESLLSFADAATRNSGEQAGTEFSLATRYRRAEALYVPKTEDAGTAAAASTASTVDSGEDNSAGVVGATDDDSPDSNVERFAFDFDNNGQASPLTDGILLLRYLAGFRGAALTDGVADSTSAEAIGQAIERQMSEMDIDGDGQVSALTDGMLTLRYLAGFRNSALVNGAVGKNATRSEYPAIQEVLQIRSQSTFSMSANSTPEDEDLFGPADELFAEKS